MNGMLNGTLILKGIVVRLKIGVFPFEKITPRNIPVDLEWSAGEMSESKPDYTDVTALLAEYAGQEYSYIEELAEDILNRLLDKFPGAWSVKVTKPFPPVRPIMESASYTVKGKSND